MPESPQAGVLSAPAWHGPFFNPRQKFTAGVLTLAGRG